MFQLLIDDAGKVGPLAVAIAVYLANKRQTEWSNAVARRAAAVEDQKLRLALLERRAVAIDVVRDAEQEFSTSGAATTAAVEKIYTALKVAELVFDDTEERAISSVLQDLVAWQAHDRARARWRDHDEDRLNKAVASMMDTEDKILKELPRLRLRLIEKSKVAAVDPLPAPRRRLGF